jgi:hypothetical protein
MSKGLKFLTTIAILVLVGILGWSRTVGIFGFATPGTCKVEINGEVTQLSITDTEKVVNEALDAKTKIPTPQITCTLWPTFSSNDKTLNQIGLTNTAQYMWDNVDARFGFIPFGGFGPGGVDSGHARGSAHYEGRAIDFFFTPYENKNKVAKGWTFANWAVANASRLGIATVIYQDKIWSQNSSIKGWEDFEPTYGDPKNATIRHLDHVHIDVS